MAEILIFPGKSLPTSDHFDEGDNEWLEDHAPGGINLELVAALSTAPSRTLADLARKVEVLALRLVPGGGVDAGLCAAEAALLQSIWHEIRKVADDVAFAAREVGFLAPIAAE
jgi:hypothetical protein